MHPPPCNVVFGLAAAAMPPPPPAVAKCIFAVNFPIIVQRDRINSSGLDVDEEQGHIDWEERRREKEKARGGGDRRKEKEKGGGKRKRRKEGEEIREWTRRGGRQEK